MLMGPARLAIEGVAEACNGTSSTLRSCEFPASNASSATNLQLAFCMTDRTIYSDSLNVQEAFLHGTASIQPAVVMH
jgi:hypothetical protein